MRRRFFGSKSLERQRILAEPYFGKEDLARANGSSDAIRFRKLSESAERVCALAGMGTPCVRMLYSSKKGQDCQIGIPKDNGGTVIIYSAWLADRFGGDVHDAITSHEMIHFATGCGEKKADARAVSLLGSAKGLLEFFEFKRAMYLGEEPGSFAHRCIVAVDTGEYGMLPKFPGAKIAARLIHALATRSPPLINRIRALEKLKAG
jgi:hypothetical protein